MCMFPIYFYCEPFSRTLYSYHMIYVSYLKCIDALFTSTRPFSFLRKNHTMNFSNSLLDLAISSASDKNGPHILPVTTPGNVHQKERCLEMTVYDVKMYQVTSTSRPMISSSE